jgi:hypothetical protein
MPADGTYETIATTSLTSSQSQIVFSSIPATYTDLVIYLVPISDGNNYIAVQFNSDTSSGGSNYSRIAWSSNGSSVAADQRSNRYAIEIDVNESLGTTGSNTTNQIHIFNYANTSTFKAIHAKNSGSERNTGGWGVGHGSGTWRSTDAINSVRLSLNAGNFTSGTRATLYGIKAA